MPNQKELLTTMIMPDNGLAGLRPLRNTVDSAPPISCCITVPALNEEATIPKLIDSITAQTCEVPVALVVADDGSTDATADIVKDMGGIVTGTDNPRGVGPARQRAVDWAIACMETDPERTLLIQTDADCLLSPGYIGAVVKAFHENPAIQVSVGPSVYTMPLHTGESITLATAKQYGNLLGTTGLRGYFTAANRDVEDYLLEPPFRYLVGVNTVLRASLFTNHTICYPSDKRWETLDLSIRLQQQLPSSKSIHYIKGQHMQVSPRAILGGESVLTPERIADIREAGYVGMYKNSGVDCSPYDTARTIIHELDTAAYGLGKNQFIKAIVSADTPQNTGYIYVPAIHSATRQPIPGKLAVVGDL